MMKFDHSSCKLWHNELVKYCKDNIQRMRLEIL